MNVLCVLTAPPTGHPPVSLCVLRLPYSLKHNNMEIRPTNNPTMASKCSSERKSCMSLTLNQKLEMIELSEQGMLKAQRQKARPLCQTASQLMNIKQKSWDAWVAQWVKPLPSAQVMISGSWDWAPHRALFLAGSLLPPLSLPVSLPTCDLSLCQINK